MTSFEHFELTRDEAGIAWLTIDVKGRSANILSQRVMAELCEAVDSLVADPPAGFVFRSGKTRGFIFGADINEFALLETREAVESHIAEVLDCFGRIEQLPCPTVILVDGICVGGGLELALAFDRIIGIEDASCQFGFPEINLGLLPGYGGSARAFERAGAKTALQLVLHGRPMKAAAALEPGMALMKVTFAGPDRPATFSARAHNWMSWRLVKISMDCVPPARNTRLAGAMESAISCQLSKLCQSSPS